MSLNALLNTATDKTNFKSLDNYIEFCTRYLDHIETGLQARIVSQNESHYQFFQYKEDGSYNITRPLNSLLMLNADVINTSTTLFKDTLNTLRAGEVPADDLRTNLNRCIYTIQQSIGATLDALPAGKSNQARKVNGDLFERFIGLIINSLDAACVSGSMQVPVKDDEGNKLFDMKYQHDLMISKDNELKVIGSVKTSSKDRIDKVFMDKFLYSKLTETTLPHIAIFLNDVQRKPATQENKYGVSSTFLPGHFKAFTIKLNALDGVYYSDIRPNMISDDLLSKHIKTIDHFFYTDLWALINKKGVELNEIKLENEDDDLV